MLYFFDNQDHTTLLRYLPDLDLGNIQINWFNNNRKIFSPVNYINIEVIYLMASRKNLLSSTFGRIWFRNFFWKIEITIYWVENNIQVIRVEFKLKLKWNYSSFCFWIRELVAPSYYQQIDWGVIYQNLHKHLHGPRVIFWSVS